MTNTRGNSFAKRAFTLLEVLLSLTLVGIVLLILGTMIHIHLRVVDGSRTDLQDARLAHSLLKQIGDNLRGTIRYEPVDTSGMQLTSKSFTQAAAIATAKANGGSSSGSSADGSSSGTSGSGSSGTGSSGTGSSGTGSSGSGSSGSGSSGSGGSSSGSTGSGGSSSGGSSGSSTGSSSSSDSSSSSTTPAYTPPIPGLYGDETSLQLDVARLPRLDEYAGDVSSDGSQLVPPSDVKTVSYFLGSSGGLMKQEMHRAAALFAEENGGGGDLNEQAQALAPEVSNITFSYFDGTEMLPSWDSTAQGGLPIAVQIELSIPAGASGGKPDNQDVRVYTMLVQLENGGLSPEVPTPSTDSSSDSSSQSSASGDSSGDSSGGSGGSGSSGGGSGVSRTGKGGSGGGGQGASGQGGASGKSGSGQSGKGGTSGSPFSQQQFKAAGSSSGGKSSSGSTSGSSGTGGTSGTGSGSPLDPLQGIAPGGAN